MKSSEWIALVQAAFLAVAGFYAWRTYRLAAAERRKGPLRGLVLDVAAELKAYRHDLRSIEQRERLRVALDVIPAGALRTDLKATRDLTEAFPAMGDPIDEWFETAALELAAAFESFL